MRLLALETSSETGSCALWIDDALSERICPAGVPHSETLLPLVRELLAGHGLTVADLDAIAFGCGPGAFTGLRVACAVAQGLAVAHATPVVPITSLETLAATAAAPRVLALLDARMQEVYVGRYRRSPAGTPVLDGAIEVMAPSAIPLPDEPGWTVCGNAPAAYPELAERLTAAALSWQSAVPLAGTMARLAAGRVRQGDTLDPAEASPLYIRDKVAKTVAERLQEGGRA